ncbi:hypothetical protein IAQ61_000945 [Plenodomus lingam]|uniref:uncharacterized protein n=1 Tax=Leptosphaeria maculans TaxID=5022 RepID=UPI00332DF1A4|nr:hypothetical protein IAQ61_000945 [Plenodomus lingam]
MDNPRDVTLIIVRSERFENNNRFTLAVLAVPDDGTPEVGLVTDIINYVKGYAKKEDTLTMLFYARHCNVNTE